MNNKAPKKPEHNEALQVGRFGLVGILNTVVDFVVLNILAATILPKSLVLGSVTIFGTNYTITGLIVAGLISGTVAMINSFIFNMRFTFKARNVDALHAIYFFVLTMIGVYVFRPILLKFFTDVWTWPVLTADHISSFLHLPLSQLFVERNVALAVTILLVLVYNYLVYKYIVFTKDTK
ncbi:MAG: GtrA family protein [Candidatus Saccharibacteria bacterium]